MEEAPENGKESSHSAHSDGINEYLFFQKDFCVTFTNLLVLGSCAETTATSVMH